MNKPKPMMSIFPVNPTPAAAAAARQRGGGSKKKKQPGLLNALRALHLGQPVYKKKQTRKLKR
jgi:hypothetical protein